MFCQIFLFCLTLLSWSVTVSGCVAPDCDRFDPGTCVNACCKLSYHIPDTNPKQVIEALFDSISEGGPDSRSFSTGPVQPWSSETNYVVQAIHETEKHIYNDTLHFSTDVANDGHGTTLLAFSHSQDFIPGNFAYGDNGQVKHYP